jgi:nucleoside-diphosphate-sugar epimerase
VSAAVVGGSGFVGSAIVRAFRDHDVAVEAVPAPRLSTPARDVPAFLADTRVEVVEALRRALAGHDVVVVAAGIADAGADDGDALYGANSLLPMLVTRAVEPHVRVVLVSSAAVQGRASVLTESQETWPFSPYSRSKARGEELVLRGSSGIVFRPTSVHGPGREVTAKLVRFLASPLASVAGRGDRPTPQVHVANVADAVVFTALADSVGSRVVLQPSEGLSTAGLVELLGGRRPLRVPTPAAWVTVRALGLLGALSGRFAALSRRLEMVWFGQDQVRGWLLEAGWEPVAMSSDWNELRHSSRAG